MSYLAAIWIYPIKALDGLAISTARMTPSGSLEGDRRFAMFDAEGKVVNGKRDPGVHLLRCGFDDDLSTVTVNTKPFSLRGDLKPLEARLSDHFGQVVVFAENREAGFPDDTDSPGPTVISQATLEKVASWFPGLTAAEMRARVRPNLVVGGVPTFWEDRLFAMDGQTVPFRIGDVLVHGVNPCQRCAVPPRNPLTGESIPGFQKTFAERRERTLPAWAERSRFNHFYRLAVNTRIPESETGKMIKVNDPVEVMAG
jgi:uncharacterized protein